MTLSVPNRILNDTPADALPVDANYQSIEQYINTYLVNRDGSVAMTGQLTLVGDPVSANQAVRKAYVDAVLPVGIMLPWLGTQAPAGSWALANGATLQSTTYPDLFNVIGQRYGGTGGSFMLPNMAARVPMGVDSTQADFNTTGKVGGSFTAIMPEHTHTVNHDHGSATSGAASDSTVTTTGTGAHIHTGEYTAHVLAAPGSGSWIARRTADTGTSAANITPSGGNHTHTVSMPHTHAVNLPAFTGASGKAGTVDGKQIPPFVIINYIVRIA